MNTQVKSALLLAVTLALGVILGMTGRGALEQQQARGMEGGRPRGLVGHMEQTIQPRDSAQAAAIRPVLLRAAERNRRIIANVNDALRASIDTMKMELAPLIDDAQRARDLFQARAAAGSRARRWPTVRTGWRIRATGDGRAARSTARPSTGEPVSYMRSFVLWSAVSM